VFELSDGFFGSLMAYAVFWRAWKRREVKEEVEFGGPCDIDASADVKP